MARALKKKATAQDQDMLFKEADLTVLDEITIGDTKMRLVLSGKKTKLIQLWSSLSKRWNTTYRYDVEKNWAEWKKYANLYIERSKNRRSVGRDLQLERTAGDPKRTTRRKTRASSAKDSVGHGKPAEKSTRRVQRSVKKN